MSAWRPRKTALGGLPNISFIARKPEPLGKFKIKIYYKLRILCFIKLTFIKLPTGTEFKTTACPITGILRRMEIQRGKDGMKNMQFNKEVGATAGCTLRSLLGSISDKENFTKFGIRGDAWFGSVRAANEVGIRGHEGVFQIKTYHASYPKEFIEEALKDAPGGIFVALEGTTKDEVQLIALGYRYSRKTILFFILTKNAGTTTLGEPYHMKYTDSFGNVCTRYVDRPEVISNFFASSNKIDTHNQLRQDCLKLEKKWITQDPFFRLGTTFVGINVTDAFLLANYHKLINYSSNGCEEKEQKISIQQFAGILAHQLLELARKVNGPAQKYRSEDNGMSEIEFFHVSAGSSGIISSPTIDSSLQGKRIIRSLCDSNGTFHHLIKYEVTLEPSGRKRTKMRKCKLCLANNKRCDVGQYCVTCGESFSLCNKTEDKEKDCFLKHVSAIKRITRQTKKNAVLP